MSTRSDCQLKLEPQEVDALLTQFPKGVCAFDLEMTGLSPVIDKIIEIAAVKIDSDQNISTYHSLINPLITIPEKTIPYHGLNNETLRSAPTLKKPLREFLGFIDNIPMVAHNAIFDTSFVVVGMNQFNFSPGLNDVFDSCKLARSVYKNREKRPESFKLNDIAKFFDFDFDHHQAVDDAIVSLKIMAKCLIELEKTQESFNLKDLAYTVKMNSYKNSKNFILPQKLKGMKELISANREFEIKYKGGTNKGAFRPVKPISLLALPHGMVLYALCLKSKQNKYFKIKKIQAMRISND